ncbi:hypothetical protein ACFOD1_02790 [Pseudidiomarina halophila]|uniref:Uncharacterized protein n=1 Tax=Pseudidiomarina halophila TaxID=1449799 RepID=A0A432XYP7_9GAMM|nr:hypothetical protein [Pseudidiomarina halophila]RUO53885.1 hypothetical protein CWI69_00125 [Pseudidiomarina halophila]
MYRPKEVEQAIIAIWLTIALSVLNMLVDRWMTDLPADEFAFSAAVMALFCIFPYKISKGSNTARWFYSILIGMSFVLLLGGVIEGMTRVDWVATIIVIPIEIFTLFRLFHPEASAWFETKQRPA